MIGKPGQVVGGRQVGQARPPLGVAHRDPHQLGEAAEALDGLGHRAAGGEPGDADGPPQAVACPYRCGHHRVPLAARHVDRPPAVEHLGGGLLAVEGRPFREGARALRERPRARQVRRSGVLLEAHEPRGGGADQPHRLLADQVEHRLRIVFPRHRGRHPPEGPLLVGEAPVLRLAPAQLLLGGVTSADVEDDGGDHGGRLGPGEVHPHLHRVAGSVTPPLHRLELHPLHVPAAQGLHDRRERARVDLRQQVGGGHAQQLVERVARVRDHAPVHLHQAQAAGVEHADLVAGVLQDPAETADEALAHPPLGDVREGGDHGLRAPVVPHDRLRVKGDPPHLAPGDPNAQDRLVLRDAGRGGEAGGVVAGPDGRSRPRAPPPTRRGGGPGGRRRAFPAARSALGLADTITPSGRWTITPSCIAATMSR